MGQRDGGDRHARAQACRDQRRHEPALCRRPIRSVPYVFTCSPDACQAESRLADAKGRRGQADRTPAKRQQCRRSGVVEVGPVARGYWVHEVHSTAFADKRRGCPGDIRGRPGRLRMSSCEGGPVRRRLPVPHAPAPGAPREVRSDSALAMSAFVALPPCCILLDSAERSAEQMETKRRDVGGAAGASRPRFSQQKPSNLSGFKVDRFLKRSP